MEENSNGNMIEEMPENNPEVQKPENPNGKRKRQIIISAAAVAALLLVLAGIAAAAGLFGSKKRLLINAVANVFTESADVVGEVWAFDEYREMFADGKLSVEADFSVGDGVQVDMNVLRDGDISGALVALRYYGSSLFQADIYADKEEILIGAPSLTDTVFYVDRTNLEEDLEWFAEEYELDSEIADMLRSYNEESRKNTDVYEELGRAAGRLTGAFSEMYDEMKVEKADSKNLKVDGEGRSCRGYKLTVSPEQLRELLAVVREVYGSNEAFRLYMDNMLAVGVGYGRRQEFPEDYDLDKFFSGLEELIAEKEQEVTVTFYVYHKNLAYLMAEFWDGVSVEWNVYGGSFPLENTKLTMTNGSAANVYSREGSLMGDLYKAKYQTDNDGSKTEVSLEYDRAKGDLELEIYADYGLYNLNYVLEGEIDRAVPGSELTLRIDTFEMNDTELLAGDITFFDEVGEITKPEGKKRNIMRMTRRDWLGILMEISGSLYSFGQ